MRRHPLDFDYHDDPPGQSSGHELFWLLLAVLLLALSSCGSTRESAKAVAMADQSLQAAQIQLEQDSMPLDQGPDAMVAWATKVYSRVVSARRLLVPVQARLAIGYTAAELATGTTADLAGADPATFDARAADQTKLAQAEVDAAGFWDRLGIIARGVLKTALGSSLGLALGGTGIGAAAIAAVTKGLQLYQRAKAIGDESMTYGNEVTDLVKRIGGQQAKDSLDLIQKDAVERQAKRGVFHPIDKAVKAKRLAKKKAEAVASEKGT